MNSAGTLTLHKGRIEALSDGVFAVVLTLLVLELKVPELSRAEAVLHLDEQLRHLLPVFLGFAITFMIGGLFWYLHHLSFHFVGHTTPRLIVANLVFLGFVSLLPFSMALFSRYQGLVSPTVFYFSNFLGIAGALALHWWIVKSQGLLIEQPDEQQMTRLNWRIRSLLVGSLAGLVVAFFAPFQAIFVFTGVMLVLRAVGRRLTR